MSFKIGDRVTVISANSTGTIDDFDDEDVFVQMDEPEKFAVKQLNMTKEEFLRTMSPGKKPSVLLCTTFSDIRKIGSSPEPDWKDIWDSGAT